MPSLPAFYDDSCMVVHAAAHSVSGEGAVTLLGGRSLMVRHGLMGPGSGLCSGRGGDAGDAGDLLPDCEADGHLGSVGGSGHQMAAGPEVG